MLPHKRKHPIEQNEKECPFRLWATNIGDEGTIQIKSLKEIHTYTRDYNLGSLVTSEWNGDKLKDRIRENPKIKLRQMHDIIMNKYSLRVTKNQCRRAKSKVVYFDVQSRSTHYTRIWDYGAAIEKTNPGSTVKIDVPTMPNGQTVFQRKVIGLDGCFLKGVATGQLLSAVGRDANNQVYPIAWTVVDIETTDNWTWFVNMLSEDLRLNNGEEVAVISDEHKGIIEAVKTVLPNGEHR
ncbi:uncharacterized protein [Rutidosis leptorrhynchoides]|uniref:uncharacterized protein n=1 Tax=Rutidosis leptorrhynchoides TaxID=125765 RepID=UPI003A993D47